MGLLFSLGVRRRGQVLSELKHAAPQPLATHRHRGHVSVWMIGRLPWWGALFLISDAVPACGPEENITLLAFFSQAPPFSHIGAEQVADRADRDT